MCKKYINLALLIILISVTGCEKFLDIKPKDKVIPKTVGDFKMLFNNLAVMNVVPSLGNISDDDMYLTDAQYKALFIPFTKNCYIWNSDVFVQSDDVRSWAAVYTKIYYANTVLEGLADNPTGTIQEQNELKGQAYYYKAESFFDLVRTFAKQYNTGTAATDPGVPLRDEADINIKPKRATVQEVYDRVLKDLDQAEQLLPASTELNVTPIKSAALGLKARVYLQMGNYDKAFEYADKCIKTKPDQLLDYNNYTQPLVGNNFAVTTYNNKEILHVSVGAEFIYGPQCNVTPAYLNEHFPVGDKRRELFFRTQANGVYRFIGNYHDGLVNVGTPYPFNGITIAEMYLVRAECYARKDKKDEALNDLNALRIKRITPASYVPATATNAEQALVLVLAERRKELIFRNIRWYDLQRLNKESRFAKTLTRTVNGNTYTLPPGDPRYVMPIPANVILMTGMPQNPR
ncbi:RagB/SusD family nutrient uptake outer membrane protein [Pedobacter nyackensis]|uniref:RagB/SusD family nutrient uptake outer membrane protein n=1 Tax=Pedobacter nyackensis TaxID=475255 RepID=UPI00293083EF|nr:RagB/SusD family nutrient uptake outer membrane protein [Pedobacter nyackensis]